MHGFNLLHGFLASAFIASLTGVLAAPVTPVAPEADVIAARALTTLSATQISSYTPYTQLARAAYCEPTKITGWNCGGKWIPALGYPAWGNCISDGGLVCVQRPARLSLGLPSR